jgi:hypothetical protein
MRCCGSGVSPFAPRRVHFGTSVSAKHSSLEYVYLIELCICPTSKVLLARMRGSMWRRKSGSIRGAWGRGCRQHSIEQHSVRSFIRAMAFVAGHNTRRSCRSQSCRGCSAPIHGWTLLTGCMGLDKREVCTRKRCVSSRVVVCASTSARMISFDSIATSRDSRHS